MARFPEMFGVELPVARKHQEEAQVPWASCSELTATVRSSGLGGKKDKQRSLGFISAWGGLDVNVLKALILDDKVEAYDT